jgi:hypothetical protein
MADAKMQTRIAMCQKYRRALACKKLREERARKERQKKCQKNKNIKKLF